MEVTILHVEGCPHVGLARERLLEAAVEVGREVTVRESAVVDVVQARQVGLRGSPTILVNGRDPFPTEAGADLACRLYPGPSGREGAPTVAALAASLRAVPGDEAATR